jgi:hypothetical protein
MYFTVRIAIPVQLQGTLARPEVWRILSLEPEEIFAIKRRVLLQRRKNRDLLETPGHPQASLGAAPRPADRRSLTQQPTHLRAKTSAARCVAQPLNALWHDRAALEVCTMNSASVTVGGYTRSQ